MQATYEDALGQSEDLLGAAKEVDEMYALLAAFEQRTPTVDQVVTTLLGPQAVVPCCLLNMDLWAMPISRGLQDIAAGERGVGCKLRQWHDML